jgi:hypothetical protein
MFSGLLPKRTTHVEDDLMPFALWSQPCGVFCASSSGAHSGGGPACVARCSAVARGHSAKVTELPRPPGKVPSFKRLWNPTPSTPLRAGSNVEKHDVRMGPPAGTRGASLEGHTFAQNALFSSRNFTPNSLPKRDSPGE